MYRFTCALALFCLLLVLPVWAAEPVTLTFDAPQTAGMCGYRTMWDTPVLTAENGVTLVPEDGFKDRRLVAPWSPSKRDGGAKPGGLVMDAIHRSLLVRFPGAAEGIAAQVQQGYTVQKVEVALPFLDNELMPEGQSAMSNRPPAEGYMFRVNWGVMEAYKAVDPNWHAVAWALRKPWSADAHTGPTFNAYINGAGYWAKFGAQDTAQDRFPQRFGPAEVSAKSPEGRLDVTALLVDPLYGKTLAERLRRFTDCGLMLRKEETYDYRYYAGAYEWATATGGHGLRIKTPRLLVTLASTKKTTVGKLAPAADIAALAAELQAKHTGGKPTAVMPTTEEIKAIAARHQFRKPEWMAEWQWKHVQELNNAFAQEAPDAPFWNAYVPSYARRLGNKPEEVYPIWLDYILSKAYRGWDGFSASGDTLFWNMYKDAMPAPVQEHLRNAWIAWSMPDRKTEELDHPQAMQLWYGNKNKYYDETGDWRGNTSFYRDGYCNVISTMNFNHTAALGALLGGEIAGSERAMADGRHGLEYFPLRLWTWYDGTAQEAIDHYYYAITLGDQKMFADFGPTQLDRMMGRSALSKSIDEMCSAYHPALRHFIGPSGRTCVPEYLLATQEGLQYILHTLSHSGTLHDLNNKDIPSHFPVLAGDLRQAALASTAGPWAPEWMANYVDEKPLPFEMTATFKQWGTHVLNPLWRRTYLGKNYGVASTDINGGIVQAMGQWRREEKQVSTIQELGTMVIRPGINDTPFVNAAPGWMEAQQAQAILHHKNKLVVVTSPYNMSKREGVKSLQSSIALYNFQTPQPSWEIYLDGQRVTQLPVKAKMTSRITIKHGVTYLGIIPRPATNLGRTDEVTIGEGVEQTYDGHATKPALLINAYNLQRATPLPKDADWTPIDRAYGGYVVEFGDVAEYHDFAAFQRHLADAKLDVRYDAETTVAQVKYTSGADTLEMGVKTDFAGGDHLSTECFTYRRVNGLWPYLAKGIDRDSNLTLMGTTGKLEKNGAAITCEPGVMAYLQTEPITGTFAGFNPLPDPTLWQMTLPNNISVKADGRVGLMRVTVQPNANTVSVDYALKDSQHTPDMATALLVFGLKRAPAVEYNGTKQAAKPDSVTIDGQTAYVIPLADAPAAKLLDGLADRFHRAEKLFAMLSTREEKPIFVQDWYLAGPFYNDFLGKGFKRNVYDPELKPGQVDLNATYTSSMSADNKETLRQVGWKRLLTAGQPALAGTPVNLLNYVTPNKGVCAFVFTRITADRDRAVTLYTGSDEYMSVWLNGVKVLSNPNYRAALKDQDKTPIMLKKGENTVLVKLAHGWEGWNFYFRLGDEYGFPITDGISYGMGN